MNIIELLNIDANQIKPLLMEMDNVSILEEVLPELTNLKGIEYVDVDVSVGGCGFIMIIVIANAQAGIQC